jgi:hypothetical protein
MPIEPNKRRYASPSVLEDLARLAIDGDRGALDLMVRELQRDIYGLALRMLWNKEDAEDATQDETVALEGVSDTEQSLLIEEVKIGCTLAMLQCLDRSHRLAYVLGEI